MSLDLTSLEKAIRSLGSSLQILTSDATARMDGAVQDVIRAGVIQNFEFTYELSHKMLRRHLEMVSANPASIEEMDFSDLIRTGSEQGLLRSSWDVWKGYRKARGTTSHTYNHEKAEEVLSVVPDFLLEARHLLERLQARAGGVSGEDT